MHVLLVVKDQMFVSADNTDVVPPGDEKEWDSGPFTPLVKDGILYGRGASDMKTQFCPF